MFGTVDTGNVWKSQVCPRAIGGITTCHKMRYSLSVPTVTYICMGELPHFQHSPITSFLHTQPIQTPPSGPGLVFNNNILLWSFITHRPMKLQKRSIRIITDSKCNSHTEPLLKSLNILKINDIFSTQCLKFFHNYLNDRVPVFSPIVCRGQCYVP